MNDSSPKQKSLKSQSAWILFAKIAGFAISFLLPPLTVRYLTQEQVGVYRQAFQFITNAANILPLGFSMSAYYFLNRGEKYRNSTILNILLFNFFVGGLICIGLAIFPQMLGNLYHSDEMTRLAPKIGVVIWLWIFSSFLEVVAVANKEARTATAFIVLAQLTKTVLMAGAVVIFASVEAFIYAAMIQAALQTLILLFYLKSKFSRFWLAFDRKFFREQLFYALPFGLAGILWTLQTDIHTYFVGNRFSESEYAIYSTGCFQLPLLTMLGESAGVVLISRISELQARGDKSEIVRLTARAMQKLSFFYFPAYIFLFITANVFITTLFTDKYAASVPIFLVNLTILPFDIWIIDPIVRAYKEFGRFLILLRVFILLGLVSALWFGIQNFNLTEMIAIVVVATLIERSISTVVLMRKLDVNRHDWILLKNVGKTALASVAAGIITFFVYRQAREFVPEIGNNLMQMFFTTPKKGLIDFVSGGLVLAVSFAVFAPVYLFVMNRFDLIDENEKRTVKNYLGKFFGKIGKREVVVNS